MTGADLTEPPHGHPLQTQTCAGRTSRANRPTHTSRVDLDGANFTERASVER